MIKGTLLVIEHPKDTVKRFQDLLLRDYRMEYVSQTISMKDISEASMVIARGEHGDFIILKNRYAQGLGGC